MSSDESVDLLLPIDFWGQRLPTSSAKSQTRRRIQDDFDAATASGKVYEKFSRRPKVSSASKIASSSSPSPDNKFVSTARVRKKRKIPRKGPIIFSDSNNSEDEESKHKLPSPNRTCKTSTNASVIGVEQQNQEVPATSKHMEIPKATSRPKELKTNKNGLRVIEKSPPKKDEMSERNMKSIEAKLSECQNDTKNNTGSEVASSSAPESGIHKNERYKDEPHSSPTSKLTARVVTQQGTKSLVKNSSEYARIVNPADLASLTVAKNCVGDTTVSTSDMSHKGTVVDKGSLQISPTKHSVIPATSGADLCTKRSPLKKTSSDDSAEELDSSQMEQSFYTCDKLKISRSRFGAFRRKNYKFAPLIFSDDDDRRSKLYKPTMKHNGEPSGSRVVTVGTMKALSAQKNQAEITKNSFLSEDVKKSVSATPNTKTTKVVAEMVNFERSAPVDKNFESTIHRLESLKNLVNNESKRSSNAEQHRVCNKNSRVSNVKSSAGSDISSCSDVNNDLFSAKKIGNRNFKSLSNSEKKSEISDVSKTASNKTDSDVVNLIENFNKKSPQKRKALFAMNEIFFGEEIDKIKPAPSKKRTLDNNVPDKAKNESNETTLLDDDSLWSSPKKSSRL